MNRGAREHPLNLPIKAGLSVLRCGAQNAFSGIRGLQAHVRLADLETFIRFGIRSGPYRSSAFDIRAHPKPANRV